MQGNETVPKGIVWSEIFDQEMGRRGKFEKPESQQYHLSCIWRAEDGYVNDNMRCGGKRQLTDGELGRHFVACNCYIITFLSIQTEHPNESVRTRKYIT